MPEPASARSCAFMAGRTVSLALKARNHGSAIAGNCDDSFMSKNMYPVRSPLSSAKYAASGLRSSRIPLMVVPSLPLRAAAFPASTGIETLSIMRILCALLGRKDYTSLVKEGGCDGLHWLIEKCAQWFEES